MSCYHSMSLAVHFKNKYIEKTNEGHTLSYKQQYHNNKYTLFGLSYHVSYIARLLCKW